MNIQITKECDSSADFSAEETAEKSNPTDNGAVLSFPFKFHIYISRGCE